MSFVEHHLDKRQFALVRPKLKTLRRAAYVSYARRTGLHELATSGGQMLLPRDSLDTCDLDPALVDHCLSRDHVVAPRWTSMVLRTKGVSVLLISVYLRTTEGLSDANRCIIDQLLLLTAFFNGVVIIMGDWQMTMQELAQISLIAKLGLAIVGPQSTDATCSSPGGGRVIDFFLVSAKLVPYLHVDPDLKVPWKPHIGLRLSFPARLRSLVAPSLRSPRPLPPIPVADDGQHCFDADCWDRAGSLSADFINRRSGGSGLLCCDSELLMLMSESQRSAAKDYCNVATHLEFYHLLKSETDPKTFSRYIGRGALPHASIRPIFARSFKSSRVSCPIADFWHIVCNLLGWILRFGQTGAASNNASRAMLDLKSLEPRLETSWLRSAAPNAPVSAWASFIMGLNLAAVSSSQQGFDVSRIQVWLDRAEAQLRAALNAFKKKTRESFRKWLREDLRSGASAAHKLVSDKVDSVTPSRDKLQVSFDTWASLWKADDVSSGLITAPGLLTRWIPWKLQLRKFIVAGAIADHGPDGFLRMPVGTRLTSLHSKDAVRNPQAMLSKLREAAILSREGMDQVSYSPHDLKCAAKSYPVKKGLGIDFWSTGQLRPLPLECLAGLAGVITASHNSLQWPCQLLMNIMALIPKPAGGERSIAKTPLLYRLFNVMNMPKMRQWGDDTVADFDFATRGKSALTSSALRAWSNEIARVSDQHSLSILWDVDKFFDSLSPEDVLQAAVDAAYPLSELILAMSMHVAPRCLVLGGVASCILYPNRSIIAGCSHSNFFARLPIRPHIARMASEAKPPLLKVATFVDDVSQTSRGSLSQIANAAIRAAVSFCISMGTLGLKVSSKSVIVSSQPRLARAVALQLRKTQGVAVTVAETGRDLGIVNNPSKRRSTIIQDSRIAKASRKFRRIARLAKGVRSARKLSTTGAVPQAVWGLGAVGLAPSTVKRLRTELAISTGISAAGRCPVTAVAVAFGEEADPEVIAIAEQVTLWLQLWRLDPALRAMSVRYWQAMVSQVLRSLPGSEIAATNWNSVTGPFGATLCALTDQGWDVSSAVQWKDPAGQGWIPDTSSHPRPFVELVKRFAVKKLWARASQHWSGMGLADGADMQPTLALHKHISKVMGLHSSGDDDSSIADSVIHDLESQESWPLHALSWLEILLTGGYWPSERASQVHAIRPVCGRCGAPVESALHLLWTCPRNADIRDERVRSTQCYVSQAVDGAQTHACLWLRGILPLDLVKVNTPVVAEEVLEYFGQAPASGPWPSGTYFSDAGGGPHSATRQLRRCGVGVAVLDMQSPYFDGVEFSSDSDSLVPLLWGVCTPLPGVTHTVPRAELFAVLLILRNMVVGGVALVKTDSKITADLFFAGRARCLEAANADLWCELWTCIDDKSLDVKLQWVKGHGDDLQVFQDYQLSFVDVVGNTLADRLANYAAELYQVWQHDVFNVHWHHSLVQKIQARAICIFHKVLESRTSAVVTNKDKTKLRPLSRSALAFRSQHKFTTINGKVLTCRTCLGQSPPSEAGMRSWLLSPCVPDRALELATRCGNNRPSDVPSGKKVVVGRRQLHHSHKLAVFRGLFFCTVCGYTASVKAQQLAKPCERSDPAAAVRRVLALRQGKLPSGHRHWPNDANTATLL